MASQPGEGGEMKKFEYQIGGTSVETKETDYLKYQGERGWELVFIRNSHLPHKNKNEWTYYWKRELPPSNDK